MILIIPLVPPSLNQWYAGKHWAERKRIRDEWHEAVWLAVRQKKIKPIEVFPVHITTQAYYRKGREFDTSNCFPANKLAEDGLVETGIMPNDTNKYVIASTVLCPLFKQDEDKTVIQIKHAKFFRLEEEESTTAS